MPHLRHLGHHKSRGKKCKFENSDTTSTKLARRRV